MISGRAIAPSMWNIDMMKVGSVKDEVADRYYRLPSLPEIKRSNERIWNGYYNVISGLFESFVKKLQREEVDK